MVIFLLYPFTDETLKYMPEGTMNIHFYCCRKEFWKMNQTTGEEIQTNCVNTHGKIVEKIATM